MFGIIPKIPIDLVYDIRTTPELKDLIEFQPYQFKSSNKMQEETKAMFELAAHNHDVDAFIARTRHVRQMRGCYFEG